MRLYEKGSLSSSVVAFLLLASNRPALLTIFLPDLRHGCGLKDSLLGRGRRVKHRNLDLTGCWVPNEAGLQLVIAHSCQWPLSSSF